MRYKQIYVISASKQARKQEHKSKATDACLSFSNSLPNLKIETIQSFVWTIKLHAMDMFLD